MIILTIRTDNPQAEVGLYDDTAQITGVSWHAHRELSKTLHATIETMLTGQSKTWQDIQAIVCFAGPGSFTGLRIGMSVANALRSALDVPIVATTGDDWVAQGITRLHAGEQDEIALPYYGRDAHITIPRK